MNPRIFLVGICLAMSTISNSSWAQDRSGEAIANLSVKSLAQFQCAVLASFAENGKAMPHFNVGIDSMRQFLTQARASNDESVKEIIRNKTPFVISLALGGPTVDFEIGRVYAAILQLVDDELRDRETWTHQKKDPNSPPFDRETVKVKAEVQYQDKNCSLLIP